MPATVSDTRSPNPYCFSVMMKKPDEQVLHDALRAETERGAKHRGRRDQRADRDGEDVGDLAPARGRTAARPTPRRSPTRRPGDAWRSPCAPAGRFPDIRRRCGGRSACAAQLMNRAASRPPISSRAIGTPRSRIQSPMLPCQKPIPAVGQGQCDQGCYSSSRLLRQRIPASRNPSMSPSSTAVGLPTSYSVRRSFTIWYGCNT